MRKLLLVLILCAVVSTAAWTQNTPRITLEVRQMPIKDFAAEVSRQAGVTVVLDPAVKAEITASLTDVDVDQALTVIAGPNNLEWRRVQFARPVDSTVHLDEIKKALAVLESVPLTGVAVRDPSSGKCAVFAKDLPSMPDVSAIALPEGYSWATIYVVLPAGGLVPEVPTGVSGDAGEVSKAETERVLRLAELTPEQRHQVFQSEWLAQMNLVPELRREILRDRMRAMFSLDERYRNELREDMRSVFQDLRGAFEGERGRER